LALVVLSIVEQRLDAVRAVLDGAPLTEVATTVGVHRGTLHRWVARYLVDGLAGLSERSHRPVSCPHQVATAVEVTVAEIRREHPRWGAKRIRMELLRKPVTGLEVPAERTIVRILHRQGLVRPGRRKRPRDSFKRFERPAPMQLWQIDIVGGVPMVDVRTGELWEAKVVTGVDDHARFCVMATVVARATGRAVCLAFAQALVRFGVPEEVITDNGKQFTDRFGKGGEVLFDKICRKNGITHRLTEPSSPNQNGKVERFHGTFRRDLLDVVEPFESLEAAQAEVDRWVLEYNTDRPHQALDDTQPVTPHDRFKAVPAELRALVELWLPPALQVTAEPDDQGGASAAGASADQIPPMSSKRQRWASSAVEFDRIIPPAGNLAVAGRQFWLGPARAGSTVTFWADTDLIHLLVAGARVKTVRSHLSVNDLAALAAMGGRPAGPPPLPPAEQGAALEVDRTVAGNGIVSLGGRQLLAADILGGRRVSIRIEGQTLHFFDPDSRQLLRTRPNPLSHDQARRLRGARPAGPPPRPVIEPIRVQRRASATGVIMVAGQKIALGRVHAGDTVTVLVSDTTLTIDAGDGEVRVFRRTTDQPVRSIKGQRPRTATSVS